MGEGMDGWVNVWVGECQTVHLLVLDVEVDGLGEVGVLGFG